MSAALAPLAWDDDAVQVPTSGGLPRGASAFVIRFSLGALRRYEKDSGTIFGTDFTVSGALDFVRAFGVLSSPSVEVPVIGDEEAFAVYQAAGHRAIAEARELVVSRMMEAGGFVSAAAPADDSPPA